jgi:hypothetical protein
MNYTGRVKGFGTEFAGGAGLHKKTPPVRSLKENDNSDGAGSVVANRAYRAITQGL